MTHARSRRTIPILLAAFAVLCSTVARAQTTSPLLETEVWTSSWPVTGGSVSSLSIDPSDPQRLFAGTESGLFSSDDGGQSWTGPTGPGGIAALAIGSSTPPTVYAASRLGVFRSDDGGATFSHKSLAPETTLAIDPSNPVRVYAAGRDLVIRRSDDGGASWRASAVDGLVQAIASLVVDPFDSETLLAGAEDQADTSYYPTYHDTAIVGSHDGGRTWGTLLLQGIQSVPVHAIAFDPHSPGVVYAGKGDVVYRSADHGANWAPRGFHLGSAIVCLLIDPSDSNKLYIGTDHGVFASDDGGSHWLRYPSLHDPNVRALALDPLRQILHAATTSGVYEIALQSVLPPFPCRTTPTDLCLLGRRFDVRLEARDPRTARVAAGAAVAGSDDFGYFSLPAFTGDAALPEVIVKMVDASAPPWGHFWFFFSGLTDLAYTATVTDTITGEIRTYGNDPGNPYCGGADTSTIAASVTAPGATGAPRRTLSASGEKLALLSGRFQLTLTATDPRTGRTVAGAAIAANDRFGYFSLPALTGNPGLPEVFVKMLDARSLTGSFWLFQTGLTDVAYVLSVIDTGTGAVQDYPSPGAFCGTADTAAFRAGPDTPPPPGTPSVEGRWTGFFDTNDGADCATHVPVSLTLRQDGTRITSGGFEARGACQMAGHLEGTLEGDHFAGKVISFLPGFVGGAFSGTASANRISLRILDLTGTAANGEAVIPGGLLVLER